VSELGYVDMFADMFSALEEGRQPEETFYDGYVVNAVMDACYRSAQERTWVPVDLEWRHGSTPRISVEPEIYDGHTVIKSEVLPDGRRKLILKDKDSGEFVDRVVNAGPRTRGTGRGCPPAPPGTPPDPGGSAEPRSGGPIRGRRPARPTTCAGRRRCRP